MSNQVTLVSVAEQPIAVIRDRARQSELSVKVPDLCGKVWNFLKTRSDIKSNGRMIATYRGSDVNDLQIEVGAQVEAKFTSAGPVVCSSTPAGQAVMITFVGPYSDMHKAYEQLFGWCKQNGRGTGVCWEIYHHPEPPPALPKTDIYVHLKS